MKHLARSNPAFTLAEMVVAVGLIAMVGGIAFTLLSLGMTLYAQNVAINRTHADGRTSAQKLVMKVAAAAEVPILVNDAGAAVTGNGPAAGVRFNSLASPLAYPITGAVSAAATFMILTKSESQPAPQAGDKITMADLGFKGVITSVSVSGPNYMVSFASPVGSGFTPARTSGVAVPNGSKCFLLTPSAFISVGGVLRHYSRAKSVTLDGAPDFDNPANFDPVATLLPVGTQTNCFPFQFLDPGRRSINVDLRIRAPAHGGRVGQFYTYQNLTTTVAYRSAVSK